MSESSTRPGDDRRTCPYCPIVLQPEDPRRTPGHLWIGCPKCGYVEYLGPAPEGPDQAAR